MCTSTVKSCEFFLPIDHFTFENRVEQYEDTLCAKQSRMFPLQKVPRLTGNRIRQPERGLTGYLRCNYFGYVCHTHDIFKIKIISVQFWHQLMELLEWFWKALNSFLFYLILFPYISIVCGKTKNEEHRLPPQWPPGIIWIVLYWFFLNWNESLNIEEHKSRNLSQLSSWKYYSIFVSS